MKLYRNMIALIDADAIPYRCLNKSVNDLDIYNYADQIIHDIILESEADGAFLVLSEGPYFRKRYATTYKKSRKEVPERVALVRNYLLNKYKVINVKGVEADDLLAYYLLKEPYNFFVCSADKDILKQIPGKHFDTYHNEWVKTSREEALKFLYMQVLMGDSTDDIAGIKGIGVSKSKKILKDLVTEFSLRKKVLEVYLENFKDRQIAKNNFILTWKQVYLLRTEEDFLRELGVIPESLETSHMLINER